MERARDPGPALKTRPLLIESDNQARLPVPAIVRRMIGMEAGSKYYLYVQESGDLYFSRAE